MKNFSDLISEIIIKKNLESGKDLAKSKFTTYDYNISMEHYDIETEEQSKYYNKPKGSYSLLAVPDVLYLSRDEIDYCIEIFAEVLKRYLKDISSKSKILIVGLGNRHISADSLGVKVVSKINITFQNTSFPHIMAICPSVLGLTGIETSKIIEGVVEKVSPTHLVLIDSLCASSPDRLGKSIQVTDTGLCPGSGIGNKRRCIDKSICKNIISIGVPLLIYARTFINSELEQNNIDLNTIHSVMQKVKKISKDADILQFFRDVKNVIKNDVSDTIVSVKDIEECAHLLSKIIAKAINKVLGVELNE